jgi:hypothetical protein
MDVHEPLEKDVDVEPQADTSDLEVPIYRTPLSNLTRRCCCAGGLLFWIVLFITPCVCFVPLFVNSEVTLSYGGRPGQEVRLFRVSEDEARGFGLSWGNIDIENDDNSYCVQTEVRYLIWEGEATNVGFCQCYIQVTDDEWNIAASFEDSCDSIGQWQPDNGLSD